MQIYFSYETKILRMRCFPCKSEVCDKTVSSKIWLIDGEIVRFLNEPA